MKNIILAAFAALALAAAPARAGSQPQSYLDECYGKPLAVHVTGWTFDPDVSSQSIGIQVYLYTDSNCTTLYDNPTLTANVPRHDVNQAKGITGNHGFNADVPVDAAGDYWVKVFAIDATGDGNVQVGTTRSVTVAPRLPGNGYAISPFHISSVADWDLFVATVGAGFNTDSYYCLDADIGPVTNMVSDSGHSFRGTFNGNGHTLTVAIESADAWAAPFCYIDGATICNLTVTGSVTGGGNHAAGLVGACGASNTNVIRDCTVAVDVVAAGAGYAGGIVGQGGDSTLSFEDCVFSGSVSGFSAFAGGLLGWGNTMTLNIANCLSTGAFTPSGTGKFHPVACKFANRTVTATVTDAYWINTLVPTVPGDNLVPGAEGTPVSATHIPGTWAQTVIAPDNRCYYSWASAPAGRVLAHYSFNDAGNAGTNLLRAALGLDAIVRATQTTPVAGPGAITAVTDSAVLSGLVSADGAVAIPNGQHLAVPIPAPLLVGPGRPYTVVMRIRVPDNTGWRSLINMPASNDSDAMVYLHQTTRNIYLKQFDKSSGAGIPASNGNVAADQWTTLTFAFGENATDVYRDGTHVLHATGTLAGSYADCVASGGYILVGADDSYDDDLFYLSDLRIYEGAVVGALPGSGTSTAPYLISSLDDWSRFAVNVNAGVDAAACYRLDADIGTVTQTVGTQGHPFRGTFDGAGHTLTVNLSSTYSYLAPFSAIGGATISNLVVAGNVYGNGNNAGLVGCIVDSPNMIENCEVAAEVNSEDPYFAGFIGHSFANAVTLRGCVFSGKLGFGVCTATFHGWSDDGAATTLIDCLDASAGSQPIGRSAGAVCVSNTYYLATKDFSTRDGLWSEDKRGKRVYAVTAARNVTIDFGAPATTYGTAGIDVYPVGMVYRGIGAPAASSATFYAGLGDVVWMDPASVPSMDDFFASAGTLSRSGSAWTLTMPDSPVVVDANWVVSTAYGKVRLWEDGPYWTETNLGADEPWESGYYFWWGDTVGYKRENNAWVAGDGSGSPSGYVDTPTYGKDYATLLSNEWITAEGVLAPAHDAAQAHWGSSWRMPTYQDLFYLSYNCDWTWTTTNGVNGYVVRGRGKFATKSIFLPAAGYSDGTSLYNAGRYGSYWSSVPSESNADSSSYLLFSSDSCSTYNNGRRGYWYSVRPVWTTPTKITISSSEGWNAFARSVNEDGESYAGRTVILAADISVTNAVGTAECPFEGTFDGAGHTLTVAINGATPCAAPFAVVRGATIKDLIVSGTVSGTPRAAGLVGLCAGPGATVLLNCAVETAIAGFSGFAGGLVGWCGADAPPLAITNCFFTGSFTPDSGGVWHPVACKDASAAPSASVQGAYYLNTLAPTAPAANVIPGAEGSPLNTAFVAGDWARPVTAPDGTTYYLATQRTITISTTEEWKAFARSLNDAGESYAERTVTLAADISIGGTMVGTADHPFNGTFDGAGHTLDVDLWAWGDIAPFSCISGATIKRVKTTGTIRSTSWVAGGIVGGAADGSTNLILNCWSDVRMSRNIVWIGGEKVGCGGIIGKGRTSSTTVRNCLFTGSISHDLGGDGDHNWFRAPSEEIGIAGLIYGWGEAGGAHRVENCLVSGAIVSWIGFQFSGRTEMLACADGAGSLSNSYHRMVAGSAPVCPTQGVDAASMSAADLAAALGDGWHMSDKVALPVGLEAVGGLDLGTCFGATRPFDLTEGVVLYLIDYYRGEGDAPTHYSWYTIVDALGQERLFPTNLVTPGGVSLSLGKDYRIVTTSAVGGARTVETFHRPGIALYQLSNEYLPGNAYEETVTLVGAGANTGTLKLGTFMAGFTPAEDRVEITSSDMFRAFAGWVNHGYSVNAVLTADLAFDPDDLIYDTDGDGVPDANFRPVGTAEHPFGSSFDGAGHKITGLRCRGGAAAGLFAHNQGTVAGVVLEDAVLSATNAVGGIAAVNNGTVERCVVADAELSVSSGGVLGAIVGTDNGTLARNFYDGCSVASTATPSGIGTAAGDVDGARPGIRVCGAGNVNVAGVHSASSCGAGSNNRVYGGAGESLVVTLDTPDVRSDSYTAIGGTIAYSGIEVDNSGRPLGPYRYTISIPADAALGHVVTVNRDNLWGVNEGCDGTPEHPYVIRSPAGLDLLADVVNNDSSPLKEQTDDYDVFKRRHLFGVFFELGADIVYPHETAWNDASSTENNYTPIGLTESQPFDGHFDGKGHTISGIRMYDQNLNGSNNHYGIFGAISYGEVKNVTVADTRITYIGEVGGVVGGAFDRGVIANCHVKGDVCINGFARSYYHGGVAGYLERNSIISHCTSAIKITQSGDGQAWGHFGGIVGGSEDSSISHCLVVDAVIPATDDNHQGAVTVRRNSYGGLDKNRLDHNYYADCTVAGKTADVGCCIYTNYHAGVVFYGDLNDADNPDGAVPAIILRDGNANAGVLAGSVGQTTNVALYALTTAKDGEWNTLCLPFAVGDLAGTPLQGFAVKEFAAATAAGGTLRLNFSDASAGVVSGRPCAVKKSGERVVADAANVGFVFIKGAGNYYAVMAPPYGIIESSHDCLVDGSTNTMWCADRGMYADSVQSWYYDEKYRKHYYRACEFAAVRAVNVTGYTLVTGYDTHDDPSRNPVNWTLKAKRNLSDAWTVLDSRDVTAVPADALPGENCAEKSYGIAAGLRGEYRYFRFEMNDYLVGWNSRWEGIPEAALRQYVQLSEFKLQGTYEADAPLGAAAFAGVTIGNVPAATVGGADGKVDFVGGYEPVAFASGDRSALLLGSDGALAYPAAATTLGAGRAWFRLNGLQAGADVTGYTLDFGDEILSGVFSSGYADWAALHGLGAWDAADARGIHNVFRYAFNVPTGDFALLGIAFNDDGKAVILTPPLVNTSGFTFSVVVSDNVNGTGNSATYDLQPSGETVINETGKPRRFFRLRAVEQ